MVLLVFICCGTKAVSSFYRSCLNTIPLHLLLCQLQESRKPFFVLSLFANAISTRFQTNYDVPSQKNIFFAYPHKSTMAVPVQEVTKRRTFKKFTYQGVDLDDLKTMPLCDLKELFPSSFRRHVNRGFSEEEHMLIKQAERGESGIRTQCRNMMILPIMVGNIIGVHNGCNYVEIDVKPEMIGRRFKDLVPTKTSKAHGKPGVGATSSSKFVPLK